MKSAYQNSDLDIQELGELSASELSRLIQNKDWTKDLMALATRSTLLQESCPPNFNAMINGRIAVTIVPSRPMRYTMIVGTSIGPKWVGLSKDFTVEDADIDKVEHVLSELQKGRFKEQKNQWVR